VTLNNYIILSNSSNRIILVYVCLHLRAFSHSWIMTNCEYSVFANFDSDLGRFFCLKLSEIDNDKEQNISEIFQNIVTCKYYCPVNRKITQLIIE